MKTREEEERRQRERGNTERGKWKMEGRRREKGEEERIGTEKWIDGGRQGELET